MSKIINKPLLIELPYLPPIAWFQKIQQHDTIYLDKHSNYVKASYRNRCHVVGANGTERISIPLVKGKGPRNINSTVEISYDENWQKKHWKTITSCYQRSAYFEYFEDVFLPFYSKKYITLFDYNLDFFNAICKILKINKNILFTNKFIEINTIDYTDARNTIMPNKKNDSIKLVPIYNQVFIDRIPFEEDLSILDIICNVGKLNF